MIGLNEMARDALEIAKKREMKGQLKGGTMSILKHCAGEVCEAVDAYTKWKYYGHPEKEERLYKADFECELADIIMCALIAAAKEGVDIEEALRFVQEKNARRAG